MSSYYTKVIPADSFHRLEEVQLQKAADLLLDRWWVFGGDTLPFLRGGCLRLLGWGDEHKI